MAITASARPRGAIDLARAYADAGWAFAGMSAIGAALTMATAAPAQEPNASSSFDEANCKWPERPSNHYCCPVNTTFVHGECVSSSAPAPASAENPVEPSRLVDAGAPTQKSSAVKTLARTVHVPP